MVEKKRILHIIKGLGRGGAERLLVSTIRQHAEEYDFDVVYFLPWKNQLENDLRLLGCTVYCLSAKTVFSILLKLPSLCRIIYTQKYDLIHAHLPWSGILARIAGKITKVPVVYTEHNIFSKYKWPTRIVNKLTFNWQRHVIAVSDEVARAIRKQVDPSIPLVTINNGVDTIMFDRKNYDVSTLKAQFHLSQNSIIIGTVAVFRPQKRLDRWIRIAQSVSNQFDDVFFVIVGDGLLRAELEQQAETLVHSSKLLFTGLSATPDQWMACMDVYLMSSDFEGLPVALLEAMSMGCAPVVSRAGGIPGVIVNKQSGLLYDPEDEEGAILSITSLLKDNAKRSEIGNFARTRVEEEFGIKKMVEALEAVYKRVLLR